MVKEHPLLFKTEMVQATVENKKTETRRIITEKNSSCTSKLNELDFNDVVIDGVGTDYMYLKVHRPEDDTRHRVFCKYEIGDLIWVREKWKKNNVPMGWPYHYYQDDSVFTNKDNEKWKPSIFMPKEAARIWLEVTRLRVERLNNISQEDAIAEGVGTAPHRPATCGKVGYKNNSITRDCHICSYELLWNKINGIKGYGWEVNPFVWVIEFKKINK